MNSLSPLHRAAAQGDLEIFCELLKSSTSTTLETPAKSSHHRSALLLAANAGHADIVACLLAAGASLTARDYGGRTALHLAATNGHPTVAKLLIQAGADMEARCRGFEWTPLLCAAETDCVEVLMELLLAGAAVDAVDKGGSTALHHAAYRGNEAVVHRLIAAGASLQIKAVDGSTPLLLASRYGHAGVAVALLAAGAGISEEFKHLRSPLRCAASQGNVEIAGLLVAAGAVVDWECMPETEAATLAMAGYSDWSKLPQEPCPGIERALILVWQRRSGEDMAQLFARLEQHVKKRAQAALLCLHRCCPRLEEKLRMQIMHSGVQSNREDD